jgi:hypothetical protein
LQVFTKIANLSAKERKDFYGSSFGGLHYNNDLAKLWNQTHSGANLQSCELNALYPPIFNQGHTHYKSLFYQGDKLSEALNTLLQGPTVIDCGMFCQLAFWFAIRSLLGDQAFNDLFGESAFYLTQKLYSPINNPHQPDEGNPLYPFFKKFETGLSNAAKGHLVGIVHFPNHKNYILKHPGGDYLGDNSIAINGHYTIFDPEHPNTSNLSISEVEALLRKVYNAAPDINDENAINAYKKTIQKDLQAIHPHLGLTYTQLIVLAQQHAEDQVDEATWQASLDSETQETCKLQFDLDRFKQWVTETRQYRAIKKVNYQPISETEMRLSDEVLTKIPFENRTLSFATLKIETPLQQELSAIAKRFCQDIMDRQSCQVILTGRAGIGKTASLVACYKELISRGKSVLWLSEVTARKWTDSSTELTDSDTSTASTDAVAKAMAWRTEYRNEIKALLADNLDVVFLDDNNLVGIAGKILLEEVYAWYVTHPNKGLMVTANHTLTFKDCYGFRVEDKLFEFPPFPGYDSSTYQHTLIRHSLDGHSLRPGYLPQLATLSDEDRLRTMLSYPTQRALGVIITPNNHEPFENALKTHAFLENQLDPIEFIPGFTDTMLEPMRQILKKKNFHGEDYDKLSALQKHWLQTVQIEANTYYYSRTNFHTIPAHKALWVRSFEGTICKTLVVELVSEERYDGSKTLSYYSIRNITGTINYAHDQGRKRVIFINNTGFSYQELMNKIEEQLPEKERERERTLSRLHMLLNILEDHPMQTTSSVALPTTTMPGIALFQAAEPSNAMANPHTSLTC